jgi:hypothetical protein
VAGGLRGERPPCDVRVFGEGGLTSFGTVIDHPALISHCFSMSHRSDLVIIFLLPQAEI